MGSVLAKVETGACDEILHRARHQDLARPRLCHDARACMDGHAGELVIHALALARVAPGADFDTEAPHGITDALGATYGPGRPVECCEEAVAGTVDLTPTVAIDLLADDWVVTPEEIAPGAVAERDGPFGRADEVSEEDSREHALRLDPHARPSEKLLDLGDERGAVTDPGWVAVAAQLDIARARDFAGERASQLDADQRVVGAVHHQRRKLEGARYGSHVDLQQPAQVCAPGPGAHAHALVPTHELAGARDVRQSRGQQLERRALPPGVLEPAAQQLHVLPHLDALGEVRGFARAGKRRVEDERPDALGIGRREEHGEGPTLGEPHDGRPLRARCLQDRAEIVHALLERRVADIAIREPRAALVEEDHAAEGCEAPHPVAVGRVLPGEVNVRDPARHDDEIERPLADDLVGNVDVAALGVAGFWGHQRSLAPSAIERILTNSWMAA